LYAFGTIAGGAGARLTGGNFWQGAATGLAVSWFNHEAHRQESKNIISSVRDRFVKNKHGHYVVDPDGSPEFSENGVNRLVENVAGLAADRAKLPKIMKYDFTLKSKDFVAITENSDDIRFNTDLIPTNAHFAVVLFHEFRHAWQFHSGLYDRWMKANTNNYRRVQNLMERDAYWYQDYIGGGSYYDGYSSYMDFKDQTKDYWKPNSQF
jgi:hypothetical protein